jgi:hypothetical protein
METRVGVKVQAIKPRHIFCVYNRDTSAGKMNQRRTIFPIRDPLWCWFWLDMAGPTSCGGWGLFSATLRANSFILRMHRGVSPLQTFRGAVPGMLPTSPGFCVP